jgi:hypothetical protein
MTPPENQASPTDHDQLVLLSWLWIAYGGLAALMCFAGLAMIAAAVAVQIAGFGALAAQGPLSSDWPGNLVGLSCGSTFLLLVGGSIAVTGAGLAAMRVFTGLAVRRHRHWALCLVFASVNMLILPIGTALGIASLLLLLQPPVQALFRAGEPPPVARAK